MGRSGGGVPLVACLSDLIIDHAYLLRRSTAPTPKKDTSNIKALVMFFFRVCITQETHCFNYVHLIIPVDLVST